MSTKDEFVFFTIYKKIVRLSFDILARKCVGNSKVVPNGFQIKQVLTYSDSTP